MGYDFASFCRNMKNAGIFIPDKSERKTHREEGTIIQLDLQKVRWDDFAFRLVFAGTRGTGTYVEPFAVTEAKVLLAKGSGNQTVWTLNARFPEKIIAIEEFAFSKENEPRIVQRVGLDSFRTC
jgi:hypothetical protein